MSSWNRSQILQGLEAIEDAESKDKKYAPRSESELQLGFILEANVTNLRVEFIPNNTPAGLVDPRVIFQISLLGPGKGMPARQCQLSMEYTGDTDRGELTLKNSGFNGTSPDATAAFDFNLKRKGKRELFREWIRVLQAKSKNKALYSMAIAGDMTKFNFKQVTVNGRRQVEGTRDWIAQAFTRLYIEGMVDLRGTCLFTSALNNYQVATYDNFNPQDFRFQNIIDKTFRASPSKKKDAPPHVLVQEMPMYRGTFTDPRFYHHDKVKIYDESKTPQSEFRYNYEPLPAPAPAQAQAGPSGGQAARPGGNGPIVVAPPRPTEWLAVRLPGGVSLRRDANARADSHGYVSVYDSRGNRAGKFHPKKEVYKPS